MSSEIAMDLVDGEQENMRSGSANSAPLLSSVSLVFPAYNEEANIERTISRGLEAFSKYFEEVIVIPVNDGGSDRTGEIVDRMADFNSNIRPVHHEVNKGYGSALRSGFDAAETEFVFFSDSDGQFDLEEIAKLLPYVDDYDMILGYRENRADPMHRKLNAWAWGTMVRFLFGFKAKDVDCAFKLFRKDLLDQANLVAEGAMVNTELLAKAKNMGKTMINVPVSHYAREEGEQTGANPFVILRAFLELFKLYRRIS